MFSKVSIPVLGIIENMAVHHCSACGHEEHIFGFGGGERLAREQQVPFLGSMPLNLKIREQLDGGKPTVAADETSDLSQQFISMARNVALNLAARPKNYGARFPKIVVEQT